MPLAPQSPMRSSARTRRRTGRRSVGHPPTSAELAQRGGDGSIVADRDPPPGGALVEGHVEGQTGVIEPEEMRSRNAMRLGSSHPSGNQCAASWSMASSTRRHCFGRERPRLKGRDVSAFSDPPLPSYRSLDF